jgi:hypothetical protein
LISTAAEDPKFRRGVIPPFFHALTFRPNR